MLIKNHPVVSVLLLFFYLFLVGVYPSAQADEIVLENQYVKYAIGPDGMNHHFIDQSTGRDFCDLSSPSHCAAIQAGGQEHPATAASYDGQHLNLEFGDTGIRAAVKVTIRDHYFLFEVAEVSGGEVDSFTFLHVPLVNPGEPLAGCVLALDLQTNVPELPQANRLLRASAYSRFGLIGAEAALIGCPLAKLRDVMKEVVSQAREIPRSSIGGPWAMDAPINQGSYLFNFGDLSIDKVDEWIALAKQLGITQIDFHGGSSFRFGDCEPNPETYPEGRTSFKAVIDRLHEAGISAGLHTYAFFIDKKCPWVTPVPDPRLGKDATFTLAADLTIDASAVPVIESTETMSTITGFFVQNSVTLQIEDELIVYAGIDKEPPYAFTQCQRGAYGTKAAAHPQGAPVHHLKECFGLFTPDGDSTLLAEVAARQADMYNECGFDMMYLDALDGESILGGWEYSWHYGSKYVFELASRLKKPALMEMSTFHHHLWYVRSRMGAWDHPTRGHKRFIDLHCQANEELKKMFLPGHLGWWAIKTWSGIQGEPTFFDDIEYLCGKCLGHDVGLSIMGIHPENRHQPLYQRFSEIIRRYENLRHAGYFGEKTKKQLRQPGKEFTLKQTVKGEWQLVPRVYIKHKVEGLRNGSNTWNVNNPYADQPLQLRLEALMSTMPYGATEALVLTDCANSDEFADRAAAEGVNGNFRSTTSGTKGGPANGILTAANTGVAEASAAWSMTGKAFSTPLNLDGHQALGVWVKGDGRGEVLNLQLRSPEHLIGGYGERYIVIDFTGWKYFELIEMESERYSDYRWPYGSLYSAYRENLVFSQVDHLNVWLNNIPAGQSVECQISPIQALPTVSMTIKNPTVRVGDTKITFPVELQSGEYIEMFSAADCKHYGKDGNVIANVKPVGNLPLLRNEMNTLEFQCEPDLDLNPRVKVTVICEDTTEGK
ncbi:MAG TPA: hypothetical protein PLH79_08990 [bacterium]|nr:hypothetical protein [bacterium]